MTKLKLRVVHNDKPVKMTIDIPAATHQSLIEYAEIMERETGQKISDPKILVGPMLIRFMVTDRAFLKAKRTKVPK
jgi:hypothetical protein